MNKLLSSLTLLLALATPGLRAADTPLVDDFSNPDQTARGAKRMLFNDQYVGSQSQGTQHCENGVLVVTGQLTPGRGAPAFISIPLLLTPDYQPQDLGTYTGIRLKVKLTKGNLSVQMASTDVTNYDYHSAPVAAKRGEFVEVRVPFADLKRAWSEQTPFNAKVAISVNLVAFGMAPGPFAYEVDEIGFY